VRVAKCFEYTHPKKIVIQVKTKYFEIQNTKWKCCPQFVTNLRVSFFCWTQRKIFWRAPLTSIYGKKNTSQLFGYKHSSFVFSITKKFILVWNNLMVS